MNPRSYTHPDNPTVFIENACLDRSRGEWGMSRLTKLNLPMKTVDSNSEMADREGHVSESFILTRFKIGAGKLAKAVLLLHRVLTTRSSILTKSWCVLL